MSDERAAISADDHIEQVLRISGSDALLAAPQRWRSMAASIWRKGDVEKSMPAHDAHGLKLCLSGLRRGVRESDAHGGAVDMTVRANRVCFLPAGHVVSSRFTGAATDLHLLLERQVMDDVIAQSFKGDPAKVELLGFSQRHDPHLLALLNVVRREIVAPSGAGDVLIDGVALGIAALLATAQVPNRPRRARRVAPLDARALRAVVAMIEERLDEKLGVAVLAQTSGLSMFQFCRAFRATTGQAPHEFVITRRLERARALIAATSDDLADIAYACGFASQAHMTATFTRRFGVTPGRLRAEARTARPR